MKYCRHCGSPVEVSRSFCVDCGEALTPRATDHPNSEEKQHIKDESPVPVAVETLETQPSDEVSSETVTSKGKKGKLIVVLLILCCLVAFGGFKVVESLNDETKALEAFQEAVLKEDLDYLKNHLYSSVTGERLEEVDILRLLTYLQENPSTWDEVLKDLTGQVTGRVPFFSGNMIILEEKGKKAVLLKEYGFSVQPYSLILHSNYPNPKVYVDGEEIQNLEASENSLELQLLPGTYWIRLVYEGEYASLEKEENITLLPNSYGIMEHVFHLEGHYVYPYSNYPEAKLYINGGDTGQSLLDLNELGPIALDGSITLHAAVETPQGKFTSEKVRLTEANSGRIYLPINVMSTSYGSPILVETELKLKEVMADYQFGIIAAINNNDFSYVEPYLLEGSNLYNDQKKLVAHLNSRGIMEELLNYQIKDIKELEAGKTYDITTYEEFHIFYANGNTEYMDFNWIYTAVIQGDRAYLTNIRRE